MINKTSRTLVVGMTALGLMAMSPTFAQAAEATSTDGAAASGLASCVSVKHWARYNNFGYRRGDGVRVYNGCSKSVRVKVVFKYGRDGDCKTVGAYSRYTKYGTYTGRYDKVVSC